MWSIKLRYRKQWSSFEIIILGFAGVILTGALLLMLPGGFAGRKCNAIYRNTVYCNISRLCDRTGSQRYRKLHGPSLGQSVILLLIQIGGLGVVTIAVSIAMLSGRKKFPDAAKHDAGCDFCPEGGRNCAPDAFYPSKEPWN